MADGWSIKSPRTETNAFARRQFLPCRHNWRSVRPDGRLPARSSLVRSMRRSVWRLCLSSLQGSSPFSGSSSGRLEPPRPLLRALPAGSGRRIDIVLFSPGTFRGQNPDAHPDARTENSWTRRITNRRLMIRPTFHRIRASSPPLLHKKHVNGIACAPIVGRICGMERRARDWPEPRPPGAAVPRRPNCGSHRKTPWLDSQSLSSL